MSQRIHLYLSLALGLLLMLSAASGLVLSASVLSGHLQAPASDTQSVGQVAERLAQQLPNIERLERAPDGELRATLATAEGSDQVRVDPLTAAVIGPYQHSATLSWVRDLHRELLLGSAGRWLSGLAALALLALAAWQWRNGPPVQASMLALLPKGAGDELVQQAEQRMQEPLSRELLILIGHPQRERAIELVRQAGEQWQASGRFDKVQWSLQADLDAIRQQLRGERLALLAPADRQLLIEQPDSFIEQRTQQLFDTFAGFGLLPTEQDWLGLGLRAQQTLNPGSRIQADLGSGALLLQDDSTTWALLRLRTRGDAFDMQAPPQIAAAVAELRQQVENAGGQLLAAGGALHAAAGQAKATREIALIGGGATLGTLLLLLLAFRRPRVLVSLLPMGVALLAGCTACVLVFGQINALTLVLGASLVGVAADYPQHYLSKSWGDGPWSSWAALRETLPGLSLSLGTNLAGYVALAFTPFPALTQIALFSAAGLIGAYLCAVCLLPAWLNNLRLAPPASLRRAAESLVQRRDTPAGAHRQLAVAARPAGVLRRRPVAADAAERPAPMAGPGAAADGRGQAHRRTDRAAAHQPVLPGPRRRRTTAAATPGRTEPAPGRRHRRRPAARLSRP